MVNFLPYVYTNGKCYSEQGYARDDCDARDDYDRGDRADRSDRSDRGDRGDVEPGLDWPPTLADIAAMGIVRFTPPVRFTPRFDSPPQIANINEARDTHVSPVWGCASTPDLPRRVSHAIQKLPLPRGAEKKRLRGRS